MQPRLHQPRRTHQGRRINAPLLLKRPCAPPCGCSTTSSTLITTRHARGPPRQPAPPPGGPGPDGLSRTRSTCWTSPTPATPPWSSPTAAWNSFPTTRSWRPRSLPASGAPTGPIAASKWDRGILPMDTAALVEAGTRRPPRRGPFLDPRLGHRARRRRNPRHAQFQHDGHRAHGDDLQHQRREPVHRADVQAPLRQEQPVGRVHDDQRLPHRHP